MQWWSERPYIYDLGDDEFAVQPLPPQPYTDPPIDPGIQYSSTSYYQKPSNSTWAEEAVPSAGAEPGRKEEGASSSAAGNNTNIINSAREDAGAPPGAARGRRWVQYNTQSSSGEDRNPRFAATNLEGGNNRDIKRRSPVVEKESTAAAVPSRQPAQSRRHPITSDSTGAMGVVQRRVRSPLRDNTARSRAPVTSQQLPRQQQRRAGGKRRVPWYLRPLVTLLPFLRDWGGFM